LVHFYNQEDGHAFRPFDSKEEVGSYGSAECESFGGAPAGKILVIRGRSYRG
jgi:hypothetical protein